MQSSYLLTVLTFLPLAGAAVLLLLPRRRPCRGFAALALIITVAEFLISLLLLRGFQAGSAAFQFEENRALDSQPADFLPPGRGRHQPVPGPADDISDAARRAGLVEIHRAAACRDSSSRCWRWRPA